MAPKQIHDTNAVHRDISWAAPLRKKFMTTFNKSTQAIPDTHSRERQWFSRLLVPARSKRLRTGEPIDQRLFDHVREGVAEAILFLEPGHPYKAKYFVDGWDDLSNGDRRRAGRCIADFTRRNGSPIGLIRRGKNQSHRYFIHPVTQKSTPVEQTTYPQQLQS